ncbi:MAG: Deoxycytidine monophosphate (dCMP) deaminase [Vezdaea aestivalis]|nr:MAG: Deoxycytidine monophosphate (dCMP) deaminase [Vezdaea aestivalis]
MSGGIGCFAPAVLLLPVRCFFSLLILSLVVAPETDPTNEVIDGWTYNQTFEARPAFNPRGELRCSSLFPYNILESIYTVEPDLPVVPRFGLIGSLVNFCAEPDYGGTLDLVWRKARLAGAFCAPQEENGDSPRVMISQPYGGPKIMQDWKRWHLCRIKCSCARYDGRGDHLAAVQISRLPALAGESPFIYAYSSPAADGVYPTLSGEINDIRVPLPIYFSAHGFAKSHAPVIPALQRAAFIAGIPENLLRCDGDLPPWPLPPFPEGPARFARTLTELCIADFQGGSTVNNLGGLCTNQELNHKVWKDEFAHPFFSEAATLLQAPRGYAALAVRLWCMTHCVCAGIDPASGKPHAPSNSLSTFGEANYENRNFAFTRYARRPDILRATMTLIRRGRNAFPDTPIIEPFPDDKEHCATAPDGESWCFLPVIATDILLPPTPDVKPIEIHPTSRTPVIPPLPIKTAAPIGVPLREHAESKAQCGRQCEGPTDCDMGVQGCICMVDAGSRERLDLGLGWKGAGGVILAECVVWAGKMRKGPGVRGREVRPVCVCTGKHSVVEYLVRKRGFTQLSLDNDTGAEREQKETEPILTNGEISRSEKTSNHRFSDIDSLIDFVTKRWQQRWVTADIWSEETLEILARRPFFLLVSVDAPLSVRWNRFKSRHEAAQAPPPSLEAFITLSDTHLYNCCSGLASLIDRADIRLINSSSSLPALHKSLDSLDLVNEERIRPSWDQYFMQLASLAAQRSNCMKRRVGCVLVRDRRVVSTGYNGTPRGIENCNRGGCPRCNGGLGAGVGLSTCLCLHAEENALLEAGRERIREGSTLYCDTIKIAQVGISEVVYNQGYSMDNETAAIFKTAGVCLRQFSPPRKGLILTPEHDHPVWKIT